jgi:7-carboxy-7-deazaguanine synthase
VYVAETFVSLQGEGRLIGTPSFFIRAAGCNLRCRWCDTPYASWLPEGRRRAVGDLLGEALETGMKHVVITGGEPLLQREIGALTHALRAEGLHITVETAATADPDFECDLLSVSPKTANSDPQGPWRGKHQARRRDRAPMWRLLERCPDFQLKFVVSDRDDLSEIVSIIDEMGGVEPGRVLLMAEGRTAPEAAGRAPEVAALCLEHGFRYTPRLHLDLFGGGRGV